MGFNIHALAQSQQDASLTADPGEIPEEFQDINITLDDTAQPLDLGPVSRKYNGSRLVFLKYLCMHTHMIQTTVNQQEKKHHVPVL